MNKYWIIPAFATVAMATGMIYSMLSIEKANVVDGNITFIDGTHISSIKFESSDTEDRHKVAEITLTSETQEDLNFAIHLNDSSQKITFNVGDFPLKKYCQGKAVLKCSIPISRKEFEQSVSMGIAAYKVPGQLIQVKEGRADWDDHRALFPTVNH